ncbi:bacteriophage holin [Actinocrispum wychmicini]|uniref:Uncharacterized protein n=1 Tax=Actinocrispum wychmicini TaxID=1213861 RepID=A0A4R2J5F1_9PSEU|nr:bacteriophage holin [Actinocrispum wychmicini]TCO53544.1 hypothetical protein EV192_110133 [Actinocrispum wychmicini]
MSFVLVAALMVVGLVIAALTLLKVARSARRLAVTRTEVTGEVNDAKGMLRARTAALRIAVRDRLQNKTIGEVTKA